MALITCTHCGASGNAPDKILGQQVRCSKCKKSFLAEDASAAPPASPFALDDPAPPPPDDEEEGFPTGDEIGQPPARRSSPRDDEDEDPPIRSIRKRPAGGGGFVDLLMFRRMIAPSLIIILFWMGLVGVVVSSIGMIGLGFAAGSAGIPVALGGVLSLFIGPLAVRLWCEVLIVIFRINESLTDIREGILQKDGGEGSD